MMKLITLILIAASVSTPAWALKPAPGKAHATIQILRYPKANSTEPSTEELVCERQIDVPVLDLRNQKKPQLRYTLGEPCKTTIGGEPATVNLDFASALIVSELDGVPTKVISSFIDVSADSTGNYFTLGSPYVETPDLEASGLRVRDTEMAYLLPDLPPNKESWKALIKVEFTAQ